MNKNRYSDIVRRYLARGALGISVGLSAVALVPPSNLSSAEPHSLAFSKRLSAIQSAVSDLRREGVVLAQTTGPSFTRVWTPPPPRPPKQPKKG